MPLVEELRMFSSGCEHILSALAMNRPLTQEEAEMIQYYCLEILTKISPALPKPH